MSEMVERVARALADIEAAIDADMFHYPYESRRDSYNALARAAIEAMREPTDDMKNCNEEVHWGYSCHTCGGLTEGWYAMIDAALQD